MKKLILGLLLTAGICGNAMASEGKLLLKKIIESDGGCTIYGKVNIEDSCGNVLSTTYTTTQATGSDCAGAVMGLLFKNYYTVVPGCQILGPVNQVKSLVQ
jgi:hypothetical protein